MFMWSIKAILLTATALATTNAKPAAKSFKQRALRKHAKVFKHSPIATGAIGPFAGSALLEPTPTASLLPEVDSPFGSHDILGSLPSDSLMLSGGIHGGDTESNESEDGSGSTDQDGLPTQDNDAQSSGYASDAVRGETLNSTEVNNLFDVWDTETADATSSNMFNSSRPTEEIELNYGAAATPSLNNGSTLNSSSNPSSKPAVSHTKVVDLGQTHRFDAPLIHPSNPFDDHHHIQGGAILHSDNSLVPSSSQSDVGLRLNEAKASCMLGGGSMPKGESVELMFFYELQTTALSKGLLEDIEYALIEQICNGAGRRLSLRVGDDNILAWESWESTPKDVISNDYVCSPTNPFNSMTCHVVEGGMTLQLAKNYDHKAAIVSDAYKLLDGLFELISFSGIVEANYIGYDPSSLMLRERNGDSAAMNLQTDNESHISYTPLIIAVAGALIIALGAGFYNLVKGRRGIEEDSSVKHLDDKSLAHHDHDSLAHETVMTMGTASIIGISPIPSYDTKGSNSGNAFAAPSFPLPRSHTADDISQPKQQHHLEGHIILNEDEATQTSWRRLGILPFLELEGIREEVSSGSELYDERSV